MYQNFSPGLYLVSRDTPFGATRITHYGLVDVGNRMHLPLDFGGEPAVIHNTVKTDLTIQPLSKAGLWWVEKMVPHAEEKAAMMRLYQCLAEDAKYDLLSNNCEQFATYVARGHRANHQMTKLKLYSIGHSPLGMLAMNLGVDWLSSHLSRLLNLRR